MVADGIVEHAHRACVRVLNVVGPYTSTVNGPETFGTTDNIRATSRSYMLISGGDEGDICTWQLQCLRNDFHAKDPAIKS